MTLVTATAAAAFNAHEFQFDVEHEFDDRMLDLLADEQVDSGEEYWDEEDEYSDF